ncbi:hypothetical protein LQ757_00140 [Agromyces sp. SYSU K20354]|uniref:hypothetical protein n=1 Tax=Agromyces cavernae TaxID=2898659 RepID=UPI001E580A03|nr:hypothetical protein [Agromyces cavernae]MCD2440677.1 hypothetical protein [Agromyces cavernae]
MTAATDATAPRPTGRNAKARERNLTRVQARVASQQARAEFAGTLNALEDKLNVPKQVGIRVDRAKTSLRAFYDERPGAAIAAAVGVVAAVGVGVWLIVRATVKD